jgi:hypothetical protein
MPTGSRRRRSSKIKTAHQGEAPTSIHLYDVPGPPVLPVYLLTSHTSPGNLEYSRRDSSSGASRRCSVRT